MVAQSEQAFLALAQGQRLPATPAVKILEYKEMELFLRRGRQRRAVEQEDARLAELAADVGFACASGEDRRRSVGFSPNSTRYPVRLPSDVSTYMKRRSIGNALGLLQVCASRSQIVVLCRERLEHELLDAARRNRIKSRTGFRPAGTSGGLQRAGRLRSATTCASVSARQVVIAPGRTGQAR